MVEPYFPKREMNRVFLEENAYIKRNMHRNTSRFWRDFAVNVGMGK